MATLGEWYLLNSTGSPSLYQRYLREGQRIGQAFFNALSAEDRGRIRGTMYDPFYDNTSIAVERAIDFLTTKKGTT